MLSQMAKSEWENQYQHIQTCRQQLHLTLAVSLLLCWPELEAGGALTTGTPVSATACCTTSAIS